MEKNKKESMPRSQGKKGEKEPWKVLGGARCFKNIREGGAEAGAVYFPTKHLVVSFAEYFRCGSLVYS